MEEVGVIKFLEFGNNKLSESPNLFNKGFIKKSLCTTSQGFFVFGKNTKATSKSKKIQNKAISIKTTENRDLNLKLTQDANLFQPKESRENEIELNFRNLNLDITEKLKLTKRPISSRIPSHYMKNYKKKKYYDSHIIGNDIKKYKYLLSQQFNSK